jgi:hypothetical protein
MTEKQKIYLNYTIKELTVMNEGENPFKGSILLIQKTQLIRSIINKATENMRYYVRQSTSPMNDGKCERRFEAFCDLQPEAMAEHYRKVAEAEVWKAQEEYTTPVDGTGKSHADYD